MSKNCGSVKNPCKICFEKVTTKTGLQCQGACKKWAHYNCLNYTPGKIQDIQKGFIKVLCPCPGCDKGKEIICKEKQVVEGSCENEGCPSNSPPICSFKECASSTGLCPPCPHCPVQKQATPAPPPCGGAVIPTLPKCSPAEGPPSTPLKSDKDIQNCPPKKSQSCSCAMFNQPCPNSQNKNTNKTIPQSPPYNQSPGRFSLTITGLNGASADKDIQSCPSQRSQSCTCTMMNSQPADLCFEPNEINPTSSDDAVRGTLVQLGATVGQLAAQVEELMTQINQP